MLSLRRVVYEARRTYKTGAITGINRKVGGWFNGRNGSGGGTIPNGGKWCRVKDKVEDTK